MEKVLAFEVYKNGKKLCTAGIKGGSGVVSAILSWVARPALDPEWVGVDFSGGEAFEDCHFRVGGLDTSVPKNRANLEWLRSGITEGDEITLRVVRTENLDLPATKKPADAGG